MSKFYEEVVIVNADSYTSSSRKFISDSPDPIKPNRSPYHRLHWSLFQNDGLTTANLPCCILAIITTETTTRTPKYWQNYITISIQFQEISKCVNLWWYLFLNPVRLTRWILSQSRPPGPRCLPLPNAKMLRAMSLPEQMRIRLVNEFQKHIRNQHSGPPSHHHNHNNQKSPYLTLILYRLINHVV